VEKSSSFLKEDFTPSPLFSFSVPRNELIANFFSFLLFFSFFELLSTRFELIPVSASCSSGEITETEESDNNEHAHFAPFAGFGSCHS
jgi:hypothetical protein